MAAVKFVLYQTQKICLLDVIPLLNDPQLPYLYCNVLDLQLFSLPHCKPLASALLCGPCINLSLHSLFSVHQPDKPCFSGILSLYELLYLDGLNILCLTMIYKCDL